MTDRLCDHCVERPAARYRRICDHCRAHLGVSTQFLPPPAIAPVVPPGDWRYQAACRGLDPDWWHPVAEHAHDPNYRATIARAKRICSNCTVRACCLDVALRNREPDGIWGGLEPHERQALAQRRRHAATQALDRVRELAEVAP